MTETMIDLPSVIAKSDDTDFLQDLIQDAAHGERSPDRANHLNGYALGASETPQDVTNMTFPIRNTSGHVLACLTCPLVERIDDNTASPLEAVPPIFEETALRISRQISGA